MSRPIIILFTFFTLLSHTYHAQAKSKLLSDIQWSNSNYTIRAELYYDKFTHRPDLWVDYIPIENPKLKFKATSLQQRIKEADYQLHPRPVTKAGQLSSVIFDAYDSKTGQWDGNHRFVLVFMFDCNVGDLDPDYLIALDKQFPGAVIHNPDGSARTIKALLIRSTWEGSFPVAAMNVEPLL